LADALGGEVGDNPNGREIGTIAVTVDVRGDRLLGGLGELVVNASHRQSVLRLPESAVRLAHNERDANQAFRIGERIFGVQFHPEWDHVVIRAYLEERKVALRSEGLDPQRLLAEVRPSPHGVSILRRFGEIVSEIRS
jgi:GMP synthase (glutamine-hydrolysing)